MEEVSDWPRIVSRGALTQGISVPALGSRPVSENLRLLIVTHAPLSQEHGAAQVALNLANGLRMIGLDVTLWSPHPLMIHGRWWSGLVGMREKLDEFIDSQPKFDVIDAPASLITKEVRRQPFVLVRSVQPDLRYLVVGVFDGLGRSPLDLLRILDRGMQAAFHAYLVVRGWARADLIMCMGTLELQWMRRWFPWWNRKLRSYLVAVSDLDQERLRGIRSKRAPRDPEQSVRFLWIGRWARHKGNIELLDFARKWLALRPQDRFTIAGSGKSAPPVIPDELVKSGRIDVVPEFSRQELPTLLAAHDIGLFTSRVEGWGLVLNEMLESGMPVYATQAGGVCDLATYMVGHLRRFPPRSLELNRSHVELPNWADYYRNFSWNAITTRYLEHVQQARQAPRRSAVDF